MRLFLLLLVSLTLAGSASAASTAYKPFANPPLAAKRLVAVLNAQLVTKATRCKVTNPYRIQCSTVYHRFHATVVLHKVNPYMLWMDTYLAGQHVTGPLETKVAY
jgi:hypothetical protein